MSTRPGWADIDAELLAAFILERITADEAVARAATPGRWKLWAMSVMTDQDGTSNVDTAVAVAQTGLLVAGHPRTFDAAHIARWYPARVLAECQAKRQLVERITARRHTVIDDCWYTCAAATEERDGGECCDDSRLGGEPRRPL
jgi:hypothetical protein